MMPRMHPSAVLSSGVLLLSTGLSSCTFLPMFSSGRQETPRTLGARMEKHTEVLQKDIYHENDQNDSFNQRLHHFMDGSEQKVIRTHHLCQFHTTRKIFTDFFK